MKIPAMRICTSNLLFLKLWIVDTIHDFEILNLIVETVLGFI